MATRRDELGANLTPMVKLVKRSNRTHSGHFGSYQIEVMTATMFARLSGDYRNAMKCFFEWAPKFFDVNDPAGYGGSLGAGMTNSVRSLARSRLGDAKARADKALAAEAAGNHAEAKRLWKIELGDEFPTN